MHCSECGCDLKENGILCEASVIASYDEEKGKFISIDEFQLKAKVGNSTIELLKKFGCLQGMSKSNQISLFG